MTPTKLLELFRRETDDISEPFLWTDEDFFIYLNDAQDTFARQTGGLSDRRSAMTRITYKIGDQFKAFNPRILRIKGGRDEQNRIIGVRNYDNCETNSRDDYGLQTSSGLDDTLTGPIQFILTDVDEKEIQLYPIPENDGVLQLVIKRLPLNPITNEDCVLEIREEHHLGLLDWVKYRAYMKQDAETFDSKKAADFRTMFSNAVKDYIKDQRSREDRKRTVRYGGI